MTLTRSSLAAGALCLLLACPVLAADWDPDFRLTTNAYPDYTTQSTTYGSPRRHVVADPSGRIHVVWWVDNPDLGTYSKQVFYKRYNPGSGWTADTMVSADLSSDRHCLVPSAAVDSLGNLHVVWMADPGAIPQRIYYKMCTPEGTGNGGWQATSTLLSTTTYKKYTVDVACTPDNHVHVAWNEYESGPGTFILYREKVGGNWLSVFTVSNDLYPEYWPSVAGARNNDVHVAWRGQTSISVPTQQIYYKGRIGGAWMGARENVSNGSQAQTYPSIVCNPVTNRPHVLWKGLPAGGGSIRRVIHSSRTATGWLARDTVSEPGLDHDQVEAQLVFTQDGRGHAVWHGRSAASPSNIQIRYSERTVGDTWRAPVNLQNVSGSERCNASINNGGSSSVPNDLHIVWEDYRDGNSEIYYKRLASVGLAEQKTRVMPCPMSITPNPVASGFALLRIQGIKDSRNQVANVRVFDASGRCVLARSFDIRHSTFNIPLDCRRLSSGVYLVRLDADGCTATQTLVVQRKNSRN